MNLTWIDWGIVAAVFAFIIGVVVLSKPLMRSVSDFLAAGRTGGRYLISLSQGTASLGAITIVGMLEMNYIAGFTMRWWEMVMAVVVVGISVSGWVLYRFRQTRALTMAQFFEIRYSRTLPHLRRGPGLPLRDHQLRHLPGRERPLLHLLLRPAADGRPPRPPPSRPSP